MDGWFGIHLRLQTTDTPARALWEAAAAEQSRWMGLHVTLSSFQQLTAAQRPLFDAVPAQIKDVLQKCTQNNNSWCPQSCSIFVENGVATIAIDDPSLTNLCQLLTNLHLHSARKPSELHITLGSAKTLAEKGWVLPAEGKKVPFTAFFQVLS